MKYKLFFLVSFVGAILASLCLTTWRTKENAELKTTITYIEPDSLELMLWYQDIPKQTRHIAKDVVEITFYNEADEKGYHSNQRSYFHPPSEEDSIELDYYNDYVHITFRELEELPAYISFRSGGIKRFRLILDYSDMSDIKIYVNG